MTVMTEIALLFKRRMLEQIRSPVWLFAGLSAPLLYLALFAPLLGGIPSVADEGVANVFVPGVLALLAQGSGTGIGWIVIHELKSGVVERFRVMPVRRFSLLMGNVLKDVVMFLLSSLPVIGAAALFGFRIHAGGLAVLLVLLCMLTALVSAACCGLGLLLNNIGTLAAVVTGLQLPVTLLAGVLLPISLGPVWLNVLAHLDPLYYVVEAARLLAGGVILDAKVLTAFAVTGALLSISLVWATHVYKKAVS